MEANLPAVVVPDTHGHLRQVECLVKALRKKGYLTDHRLVFLGDYFDRGPEVRRLMEFCIGLQDEGHVMLAGNHEYVLARALLGNGDREAWIKRWATRYEQSTLASYGVKYQKGATWTDEVEELKTRMPKRHLDFISSLPWIYESSNLVAVHAGVDPEEAWQSQRVSLTQRDHPAERGPAQLFSHKLASDTKHSVGKQVVSGHASRFKPFVSPHRVMLDCGVDSGGPLMAWVSDTNQLLAVE